MDAFASAAASRASWSKAQKRVNTHAHLHRKEPAVTLPLLSRRASGQQSSTPGVVGARNASLHAFLASQLENNERENYSRSQLRAMACSKLLSSSSSNNNLSSSRIHSSAERLAPLDPASFEKTRAQRRPLPGPLQAAINEVLAVKTSSEVLSERGESRDDSNNDDFDDPETPVIPICKRVSPRKTQLQSRRPEWQRYIRRIMMTKGIRGSTLARYRRLVGIVARRNLTHSYAGAAERVVRYRLEFRSAAAIQTMTRRFLTRRRQAKLLQRHQAAAKIQCLCRRVLAVEKQRKLAEIARLAEIERFRRVSAARTMQRSYRKYRLNRRLREEQQRQLQQASMLQKARLKLLRRYQSWRKSSKQDKVDPESECDFNLTEDDISTGTFGGESSQRMEGLPLCALATGNLGEMAVLATWCEKQSTEAGNEPSLGFSALDNQASTSESIVLLKEADEQTVEDNTHSSVSKEAEPEEATEESDNNASAGHADVSAVLSELSVYAPQQQLDNSADEPPVDSEIQSNQLNSLESASPSKQAEEKALGIEASSTAAAAVEVELGEDSEFVGNNDVEAPEALSYLNDDQQQFISNNSVDIEEEKATPDLEAAIIATTVLRAAAAKKIACFLLPKLQAKHALKTHAAIQIQCLARLYLAKQRLTRVRHETLQSLRAQLHASWQPATLPDERENSNQQGIQDAVFDQNDEDDEFEFEIQGHHPGFDAVSENYMHLLPTRNGQIPPRVPLLHSSAGAPLLPLWKWSWPGERWLSTGQ